MNRFQLLKIIFEKKDYTLAEELCRSNTSDESLKLLARVLFFEHKYERAEVLFKKLKMYAEMGYCKLYRGNKEEADKIWFSLNDVSPLGIWAKAFSGYIEKKKIYEPTFFQIRNFYESDLDTLMSLKMYKYAENLINSIQYFSDINPEVYKYTARVLFNHGYNELAERFINTGKEIVYDDTELHFIEAQVRLAQNQRYGAIRSLENVLSISPSYFPAKKMLANIK